MLGSLWDIYGCWAYLGSLGDGWYGSDCHCLEYGLGGGMSDMAASFSYFLSQV